MRYNKIDINVIRVEFLGSARFHRKAMHFRIPFYPDIGLLLIRIGLGLVFIVHGWLKWQKNITGTAEFFFNLGLPEWTVYLVATTELAGGLCVLFGWLARFFSLGFVVIMAVAITTFKFKAGFVGGYEFDLVLLLMALAITLAGSGKYRLRLANWNGQ